MCRAKPGLLMVVVVLAAGLGSACDEKKQSADEPHANVDASADKYATADPKLAKALQAVTGATASDDGPPLTGVFAPGIADRRHPKGAPTRVELGSDGAEPRVDLGAAADASPDTARAASYGPALMEVGMQMGPRVALPTIDLNVALAPAKADEGGPEWLSATVRKAAPAQEQPGELPADSAKAIATLEGTEVRVMLTPDGRESDLSMTLGKAARPELEHVAKNAAEALVLMTVPTPPKPVGVGAQWLAETRMSWAGVDVIAYRAFQVKSVESNRLTLSIDVKAYAASADTELQGVPKGATMKQFQAEAQGEMEVVRGEILARTSELQERVVLVFSSPTPAPGAPPSDPERPEGSTLTAQIQAQASFMRGDDLRQAAAKMRASRK